MRGGGSIRRAAALLVALAGLVLPATAGASVGNFGMAVQPDGKILVAGGSGRPIPEGRGREGGAVVRYLPDGRIDRNFGHDGIVIANEVGPFTALGLAPDGRILLAAPIGQVARLLPDGRFDPSFGFGGIKAAGASAAYYPTSIAPGPHRSILVGGMTGYLIDPAEHLYGWLYRIAPDGRSGSLVGSMTTRDGRPGEPATFLNDFLVAADGSVIGAGTAKAREVGAKTHAALARLLPAAPSGIGTEPEGPDPSFGAGVGLVESDFFPSSGLAESTNAIASARDGVVVAGQAEGGFMLARYRRGGSLDTGFGSAGVTVTEVHGPAFDSANAVIVQPGGGIVAAGSSDFGCRVGCASLALARYARSGRLVRGFGKGGIVSPRIDTDAYGTPSTEIAYGLANQPHEGVLVGGLLGGRSNARFFLRRYLADGRPDKTFGDGGRVTIQPWRASHGHE